MVATVRCEEIGNEKYASFVANEVSSINISFYIFLQPFDIINY